MNGFGKKALLRKIVFKFYGYFSKTKVIVFDAPNKFHLEHVLPVIRKLLEPDYKDISVIIICPEYFDLQLCSDRLKIFASYDQFPLLQKADLIIKTEFNDVPYWLASTYVFFGHGIGPKLSYQSAEKLSKFDYLFTACSPIHNIQSDFFSLDKMFKVGLPILDNISSESQSIVEHFKLDKNKKTIVYAPSWCFYTECIGEIERALEVLNEIYDVNVIISPHPLLLLKERCGGKDFFRGIGNYRNLKINFPSSGFSTLELCGFSDMTISDISSIFFESLALGKKTVFEKNNKIFVKFGAEKIYEDICKSCQVIDWNKVEPDDVISMIYNNGYEVSAENFINSYIFNRGKSTDIFIENVRQLLC